MLICGQSPTLSKWPIIMLSWPHLAIYPSTTCCCIRIRSFFELEWWCCFFADDTLTLPTAAVLPSINTPTTLGTAARILSQGSGDIQNGTQPAKTMTADISGRCAKEMARQFQRFRKTSLTNHHLHRSTTPLYRSLYLRRKWSPVQYHCNDIVTS